MKNTKLFSSNFQTVAHFSSRKTMVYGKLNEQIKFPRWLTPEARALHGCTLIQKSGNLARNSAPLWLLMGRIVFLASEKTSFAILTATKKETFWRICRIFRPIGCKWKLWALFLPRVHLEKQQTAKICRVLFRLTLNACLRQTSWINIVVVLNVSLNDIISLSWLFVKISFLSLFRLWVSVVHEHRIQEYSKCRMYQMNMEFRSKMQTKMILRPLSTSVHSNSRGYVKRLVYALPAPDL